MSLSRRGTNALDWGCLRATCAPPLFPTPTAAARFVSPARRRFAALAAGYLAVVALCLPVAKTREALDAGLLAPPAAADVKWVTGLFVFASPVPVLVVPPATPGVLVGEAEEPRPRLVRARDDFERGPPSLT
jgi:hypothetical protein